MTRKKQLDISKIFYYRNITFWKIWSRLMKKTILFVLLFVINFTLFAQTIGPKLKFLSLKHTVHNANLLKLPAKNKKPATLQFKEPVNISKKV